MIITGNLLNLDNPIRMICHQCNCKGVMGSGIALQIKNKYPQAYKDYIHAYKNNELKLGNVIISKICNDLYIIHICGQDDFGTQNQVYTNYDALNLAFSKLNLIIDDIERESNNIVQVYFPYNFGCGLAKGDWSIVEDLIYKYFPYNVIVRYNG